MAGRRLYMVAYLSPDVSRSIDDRDDVATARPEIRPVASARRHLTILNLAIVGMPEALLAAAIRLVMSRAAPEAFRIVLDRWIASGDRVLIGASEPVIGFERCQAQLLAGLRDYTLALPPRHAAVRPHVTLGYGRPAMRGVQAIDGVSWLVDELTLIVSHHGETCHEPLDHWRLRAA